MQITFADGTRIEVTESALDDFIRHDLKWVEFVHGRASQKPLLLRKAGAPPAKAGTGCIKRCAQSPAGC